METCFFYYPCLNWRSNYFNNIKKTSRFICFNMKIHSCVFKLNFIFVFYYVVKLNSDHSNLLVAWTLLETAPLTQIPHDNSFACDWSDFNYLNSANNMKAYCLWPKLSFIISNPGSTLLVEYLLSRLRVNERAMLQDRLIYRIIVQLKLFEMLHYLNMLNFCQLYIELYCNPSSVIWNVILFEYNVTFLCKFL